MESRWAATKAWNHDRLAGKRVRDFFTNKIVNEHGCWIWTKAILPTGYGQFSYQGGPRTVHTLAWEFTHGPIPKGLQVCHDCPGGDNRACFNPAHLFLGTHADNLGDMAAKDRSCFGEKQHSHKLTTKQVEMILDMLSKGITGADLSEEFGVSRSVISKIKKGEIWQRVPRPEGMSLRKPIYYPRKNRSTIKIAERPLEMILASSSNPAESSDKSLGDVA